MYNDYQQRYTGEMMHGKFQGQGEFKMEDGSVYKGGFDKGNFHGQGQITFSDGSRLIGVWN